MPYDVKRFIFTVSLCAMLAVNPVLATAPTNDEELGTTHDVYVESTLNQATNGIAGVSYVNRMVNAAGNAADAAEAHAAAAGAHALSAAQSADEAHKVLANKVNIDQGADKKNLAMVTDKDGSVYAGYISTDMIEKPDQTCYVNASGIRICSYENQVLISDDDGNAKWGQVANVIPDGAVTLDKISSIYPGGGVTGFLYGNGSGNGDVELFAVPGDFGPTLIGWDDGAPIAVAASGSGGVLKVDGAGVDKSIEFAQITTDDIADGAVTSDKIADEVLSGKVNIDQGADKKNLAMVTDDEGTVYPGYITNDMIADGAVTSGTIANGAVTTDKIKDAAVTFGKIQGYQGRNYDPTTGKLLIGDGNEFGWGWIYPAMITSPEGDSLQTGLSGLAIVSDGKGNTYWGQVSKYGIEDEAVTRAKIADRVVTTDKMNSAGQVEGVVLVADGNGGVKWGKVGSAGIAYGSVISGVIADGEVTAEKLSAGIPDGFSTTGFLAYSGSADEVGKMGWRKVETNDIAEGAVTSDKIANGAVTSDKIADGAVTHNKIWSSYGVATGVLQPDGYGMSTWGLISPNDITDSAVTTDKIADGAVASDKIAKGAVFNEHIAAWAVSEDKIFASGRVAGVALVADGNDGADWGQVGSAGIADGAVTSDKIAKGAVTSDKITAPRTSSSGYALDSALGSVLTVSNVDGSVSWEKVGAANIADGSVTLGKIKGYRDSNYEPTTGKLLIGYENEFGWGSIHPAMITSPADSSQTGLSGLAIVSDGKGNTYWGQVSEYGIEDAAVTSDKIAGGAVTIDKTAGVVGMVPVGGEGATTYISFWIE